MHIPGQRLAVIHQEDRVEIDRSHTGRYWRYDVTKCGLRRSQGDHPGFPSGEVTCKRCLLSMKKEEERKEKKIADQKVSSCTDE